MMDHKPEMKKKAIFSENCRTVGTQTEHMRRLDGPSYSLC